MSWSTGANAVAVKACGPKYVPSPSSGLAVLDPTKTPHECGTDSLTTQLSTKREEYFW